MKLKEDQERMKNVEDFADFLISTSSDDITCEKHKASTSSQDQKLICTECQLLKQKVEKYQSHSHTFTCAKKKRTLTIKENEGHGRLDGQVKGPALSSISVCRFKFPKFPLDETRLVKGISKDIDEEVIKTRKKDLDKIIKFLVRQTYTEKKIEDHQGWKNLQGLDFWQFLYEVGMFKENKP